MNIEDVDEVLYTPVCNEDIKPVVGKSFTTLDAAMKFYENYASEVGFDIRIYGTKTSEDLITWRYVVCNKQGNKNTDDIDAANARDGFINKRRRSSKRCGCNAKVTFKYDSEFGYVVHNFNEKHNHPMVEVHHKRFMRVNRKLDPVHQKFIVDCAKANIGPTLTFKLLNELLGGYDSVGCTVVEVRNFARDMKAYIDGSDAQMLLNEMRRKKGNCASFSFEFEVDCEEKLKRLFWCDPVSRRNYHTFGDVVAFDTTYSTNKYCMIFAPFTGKDNHGKPVTFAAGLLSNEDGDSFSWLFRQFVHCMGVAPKLIITDQDLGMKVAIEQVFVGTRHRWCMWHIMLKLADKVSKELHANEDFKKDLNTCVWSDMIEPNVFEASWIEIVERYSLNDEDKWFQTMFKYRENWVPVYFRDFPFGSLLRTTSISECQNNFFKRYTKSRSNLVEFIMSFNHALEAQRNQNANLDYKDSSMVPIMATKVSLEKHASTIYTDHMFKAVQAEIIQACFDCRMTGMSVVDSNEVYNVADKCGQKFIVKFDEENDAYSCCCKLFGRVGILCSHIFFVFKNKNVKLIPDKYIVGRWLKSSLVKEVHDCGSEDVQMQYQADEKRKMLNKLYSSFFGLVQKVDGNMDNISFLISAIEEAEQSMMEDGTVLSVVNKKKIIEDLYGIEKPDTVDIHPPNVVKTKGSGRRLRSDKEKAVKEFYKPVRQCKKCLEYGHHDSRNCDKIKEKLLKKSQSEA